MAWTKAKTAIAVSIGVLVGAGATTAVVLHHSSSAVSVDESLWEMDTANLDKAPPVLIIRPTHFSDSGQLQNSDGRVIARNIDFKGLLEIANPFTFEGFHYGISRQCMVLPPDAPQTRYDLMYTLAGNPLEKLRQGITDNTGFATHKELRQTNVLVLKIKDPALLAEHIGKPGRVDYKYDKNSEAWFGFPILTLTRRLEFVFQMPVVPDANLAGKYNFKLQWRNQQPDKELVSQQLAKAGLELVPGQESIEMLIVERVAK